MLLDLFLTFAKVGVMTFGGGYAMLPILQREVVEKKGWVQGADGYYYYTDAVAPIDDPQTPMSDETLTNVLISNVKQIKQSPKGVDGTQYSLAIEIIAHAIQATPDEVVGQEWSNEKVQVSGKNGILTVEKKENP